MEKGKSHAIEYAIFQGLAVISCHSNRGYKERDGEDPSHRIEGADAGKDNAKE